MDFKKKLIKGYEQAWRVIIRVTVLGRYRIKSMGAEHIPAHGGVLLLGNHLSYLDWALVILTCPRTPHFAFSRMLYNRWYIGFFFKIFNYVIPISPTASKDAIQILKERLNAGEVIVLFPEGRVTHNGQIGAFQKGFEKIISETNATIIPFYLQGLWGSLGSHGGPITRRLLKINQRHASIVYGQPLKAETSAFTLKQSIFKLSISAWENFHPTQHSIAYQWLLAAKKIPKKLAIADATGVELSSTRLLVGVRFLQKHLKISIRDQDNIGVLLPLSVVGTMTNLALFAEGKCVVNLNYTSGQEALLHAIEQSTIKTIITSHRFINRLQDRGMFVGFPASTSMIYLEDIQKAANKFYFLLDLFYCKLIPFKWLAKNMLTPVEAKKTAVIIFSSGSEGFPKGIELTHQNIVTNALQVIQIIKLVREDVLLSTLPLFHAFGFTVNMLVPLFAGIPFVCQPDPTDSVMVGKLAYQYRATIFTGTATFLNMYCRQRKLHPKMFESIRFLIAGAEKVSDTIRERFKQRFGITIYEGYGTTETSPVASAGIPDEIDKNDWFVQVGSKEGSVGLPLPGTAFRIVDPESLEDLSCKEAGLILVGGPQVKRCYLNDKKKTQQVILYQEGIRWYKTGDKGYLDEDGFLYIVDRYSRFAKMGGEMVSLTSVEQAVLKILIDEPDAEVMAIAKPDEKKGERIILFYTGKANSIELQHLILKSGMENIMLPSKIIKLAELPKLGSGKLDYQKGKMLAEE